MRRFVEGHRQTAEHEHLGGERHRHVVQPRIAPRAGEVVDRLVDLDRVAGGGAEHLVHVGQHGDGRQPGLARDRDDAGSELARARFLAS